MSQPGRSGPASARLARAVAATHWRSLPDDLRRQAADLFLDTLAVAAAAAADRSHAHWIRGIATECGACTVIGFDLRAPARTAAFANAAATTVLQWQDGHRRGRGHPASHLVPALLALGEPRDADTDAVMSAFVAGYECAARIGIALGGMQDGLHDAGTWPAIGTAAAAAALLGGNARVISAAIDAAACVALQPYRESARRGDGVHHLYMGLGVTAAIDAAHCALAGLGSPAGALEDFFGPRAGAAFDATALSAGLDDADRWSRFELHEAYLKWHPVCAHFSGVADALESMLRSESPAPTLETVEHAEVAVCGTALEYQNDDPRTPLAARFSIPAIVYASLAPGGLRGSALTAISDAAHPDRAWLRRVHVLHDPSLDASYPAGRPARVTLKHRSGIVTAVAVTDVYGDSKRPLPREARREKAITAFSRPLGDTGARRAVDAFDEFVAGGTVSSLCRALRVHAAGDHAPGGGSAGTTPSRG